MPDDLMQMKTILATQGEAWKRQWKAEGLHEGQARTLLRQLGRRFGPIPDTVHARVNAADLDTLDRWLDQMVDAPTLEALFDESESH